MDGDKLGVAATAGEEGNEAEIEWAERRVNEMAMEDQRANIAAEATTKDSELQTSEGGSGEK